MPMLPNLKRFREEYPMTLRELEQKSGVSRNTISYLENMHRPARPSTVRKLAAALDVEPRELIRESTNA